MSPVYLVVWPAKLTLERNQFILLETTSTLEAMYLARKIDGLVIQKDTVQKLRKVMFNVEDTKSS